MEVVQSYRSAFLLQKVGILKDNIKSLKYEAILAKRVMPSLMISGLPYRTAIPKNTFIYLSLVQ